MQSSAINVLVKSTPLSCGEVVAYLQAESNVIMPDEFEKISVRRTRMSTGFGKL